MLTTNKKRIVHIRFTATDFNDLTEIAGRAGMTVSEYVRLLVKGALTKAKPPEGVRHADK